MTEHLPEPVQQHGSDHIEDLPCVILPAIPTVYGLEDPDEGVTDWVFVLPGGLAYIVSSNEDESGGVVHTSLDQIVHWWAPYHGVDLVLVTD